MGDLRCRPPCSKRPNRHLGDVRQPNDPRHVTVQVIGKPKTILSRYRGGGQTHCGAVWLPRDRLRRCLEGHRLVPMRAFVGARRDCSGLRRSAATAACGELISPARICMPR